ncbi:MAG: 16S rRNA (cytosine(1402)-N(4))-methyltransferase RsmH [Firmicutes bacterium]|nr:16S rRNA (cytosine(1402)-N(4))-methyltransferase RsmH [Bacillota bacterium]
MHKSVLLEESLKFLNIKENSVIVDCTLGYGGHSSNILKEIKKGFLFAFDQDDEAIKFSHDRLEKISDNYEIIRSNFVHLKKELELRNVSQVDGILYDLGVSSPQLDESERGFSFHNDAKLDMRMDTTASLSAYEVVNNYSYDELVRIFRDYGEEKFATSIAKKIVNVRQKKNIETTLELVDIVKSSVPEKYKREKHPARKVFQAIRIEVNNELGVFEDSLNQALDMIKVGGRICVITFHSLEDRMCKEIFKRVSSVDKELQKLPIIPEKYQPRFKVIANIEPSDKEIEENNRSRSARLRVIERVR